MNGRLSLDVKGEGEDIRRAVSPVPCLVEQPAAGQMGTEATPICSMAGAVGGLEPTITLGVIRNNRPSEGRKG